MPVNQPNVKGVLCADESGVAFCRSGTLTEKSAATAAQLHSLCALLEPRQPPTAIALTNTTSKVLIKKKFGSGADASDDSNISAGGTTTSQQSPVATPIIVAIHKEKH